MADTMLSWTAKGSVPFRLEVLTPVFAGSGETLSPLDYVLGTNGDDALYRVDLDAWLRDNAADPAVAAALDSADLRRIGRLFQERIDPGRYALYRTEADSLLLRELASKIGNTAGNSKCEVSACLRSPLTGAPYLPGSSLKGAMSTPLIDAVDRKFSRTIKDACRDARDRHAYRQWMEDTFGRIDAHAMKALKVPDLPAGTDDVRICRAVEEGKPKGPGRARTPKPPAETLKPGTQLWGRLSFATQHGTPGISVPCLGAPITYKALASMCNAFYKERFLAEMTRFYKAFPHLKKTADALAPAMRAITSAATDSMLLRVGHYSHIECVTVKNNRPETRFDRKSNRQMPFGTTRTLADGVLPFGWVLLTPCTEKEFEAHAARNEGLLVPGRCKNFRNTAPAKPGLPKASANGTPDSSSSSMKTASPADAPKQSAPQLSPEEALIQALSSGKADENLAVKVCSTIDEKEPELRKKYATALMAYWKAKGKWEGKLTEKQQKKVTKIKGLLA